MTTFLFTGSYTTEGIRGVIAQGGSARVDAVKRLAESLGGSVESMYFAFGEDDFFVTADVPDAVAAASLSMAVTATGAAHVNVTVLVTPEEMDQASQRSPTYSPPGS